MLYTSIIQPLHHSTIGRRPKPDFNVFHFFIHVHPAKKLKKSCNCEYSKVLQSCEHSNSTSAYDGLQVVHGQSLNPPPPPPPPPPPSSLPSHYNLKMLLCIYIPVIRMASLFYLPRPTNTQTDTQKKLTFSLSHPTIAPYET